MYRKQKLQFCPRPWLRGVDVSRDAGLASARVDRQGATQEGLNLKAKDIAN